MNDGEKGSVRTYVGLFYCNVKRHAEGSRFMALRATAGFAWLDVQAFVLESSIPHLARHHELVRAVSKSM